MLLYSDRRHASGYHRVHLVILDKFLGKTVYAMPDRVIRDLSCSWKSYDYITFQGYKVSRNCAVTWDHHSPSNNSTEYMLISFTIELIVER